MEEFRMHLTGLDFLFWAAGFITHAILLLVLWTRRRVASFPIFTALITLNVARTVALFFIRLCGTKDGYFYTFWSLAIIDVALQLGVVYEMSSRVFRPNGKWAVDVKGGLITWICGSICVAAVMTWISTPPASLWRQVVLIKGSFFSAALLSELFVGMILLSATAGLPWKTHVARIARGLGVYSVVTVLIETANTSFGLKGGTRIYDDLSRARMTVYLACVIYWTIALWMDAPPLRTLTGPMRQQILAAHQRASLDLDSVRSQEES
jgi:hypothetical protein